MKIVGKQADKYLCALSTEELMAFFPETSRPPVPSLEPGQEFNILTWSNKVYALQRQLQDLASCAPSITHQVGLLHKELQAWWAHD